MRNKIWKFGDSDVQRPCKHCEKIFKGNERDVNKQHDIHMRYVHKIFEKEDSVPMRYTYSADDGKVLKKDMIEFMALKKMGAWDDYKL
jgi:hypothetical protein